METVDKVLEILTAYKLGKEIWRTCLSSNATFADYEIDNIFQLMDVINKDLNSLYIKEDPVLRPYKNAKEFMEAMKIHGPGLTANKGDSFFIPRWAMPTSIEWGIECDYSTNSYQYVMETFEWQDGTPCGILE